MMNQSPDWKPARAQRLCRDLRHAWSPFRAERTGNGFLRELECLRCRTFKAQHLDFDGYVVKSSLYYPAGYLNPGGRLTREDIAGIRMENLDA